MLFSICTCCSECGAHGASPVLLVCLGQSTGVRVKQAYSWRITKERKARRGSNAGISFKHHANCRAECLSCGITSLAALALPEMTATVILQGLRGAASPGCVRLCELSLLLCYVRGKSCLKPGRWARILLCKCCRSSSVVGKASLASCFHLDGSLPAQIWESE